MRVRITILVDNRAQAGLEAEHGFAMWIESDGMKILFDTGAGAPFWHNVAALDIDVATADAIVLSHGHFDHTGNLSTVLKCARQALVYCHPESTEARYSVRERAKSIGMPVEGAVTLAARRLHKQRKVCRPTMVGGNVWLTGPVPRQNSVEEFSGPFYFDELGTKVDPIVDDMSIWLKTPQGLVVCVGCCHAGIVNTIEYAMKVSGDRRILALLGGIHLVEATAERMAYTGDVLEKLNIGQLILCHCTGDAAVDYLQVRLGSRVQRGYAGMVWQLPAAGGGGTW